MGSCGSSCGCGSGGQRAFLTKEEKIQALQEYKAELEKEVIYKRCGIIN